MSAQADTNCHFVSATWTHLAKIGAARCVVADMSRHVGNIYRLERFKVCLSVCLSVCLVWSGPVCTY